MRRIRLLPTEFYHFKALANQIRMWFEYKIIKGMYVVKADSILLESLGY